MESQDDMDAFVAKLFRPIPSLRWSVRVSNCLMIGNIDFVGDLVQKTERELLSIRGFGRGCLFEVKRHLAEIGLSLGMAIPAWDTKSPRLICEQLLKKDSKLKTDTMQGEAELTTTTDKKAFIRLFRKVESMGLSYRSRECLKRERIIYVGDLVKKKPSELTETRNLGRTSLAEIKGKLEEMGLQLGMNVPEWPPKDIEETLESLLTPLEQEKLVDTIKHYERSMPIPATIEDELYYFAGLTRSERDRQIVIEHYGWDGRGKRTLEAVGQKFDITRERVRQILVKFRARLRYHLPRNKVGYAPILDRTLRFVSEQIPATVEELELELAREGLAKARFRLDGLQTAAKLLGRELPFRRTAAGRRRIAVAPNATKLPILIVALAKKAVQHWGVATLSDIAAQAEERAGVPVETNLVLTVLSSLKGFWLLDESRGWFWLSSVPRNRLLNQIRKILSISSQIDISELRAGVGRHHRMRGVAPPRRVLLELCRQLSWCHVEDRTVTATPPLKWDDVLDSSSTDWALAAVLENYGPVMSRDELEAKCLELGMNRSTFFAYLSYSSIITKYDMGVYGLRGASVLPGQVASLRPKPKIEPKRKVLKDFGRTTEGDIWLALKLSTGLIRSGVFTVPAGLRRFLQGRFTLKTADGAPVGNLNLRDNSGWSLGSFFRRRGGEPGDYLVLLFNLGPRQATAYLGDADLLDDFRPGV